MPVSCLPPRLRLIACLALCQIIGWGTGFDMLAVLGPRMGPEIGLSNPAVFAGLAVMMMTVGLAGPTVGRLLQRQGAAKTLAQGSGLFALALLLLSFCHHPIAYFGIWLLMGLAGSLSLSTPTYAAVVEREGADGKRVIALLMIFTGLSATVFWPVSTWLVSIFGWRQTLLVFAALHLFVCLPLHLFALPKPNRTGEAKTADEIPPVHLSPSQKRLAFLLVACGTTIAAFVSFGFSPTFLQLLTHAGASPELALQLGAARGVIAISARAVDFAVGRRGSAILTALIGIGAMLLSFVLMMGLAGTPPVLIAFTVLYSLGSGIMAVARAVLPLSVFSARDYGLQAARLSLPQNIAIALAPMLFAALLDAGGVEMALSGAVALITIAFIAILALGLLAHRRAKAFPIPSRP